ncbi:MAG: hypothetical protein H7263_12720 [Candidatus Sericytochromatia bacterium]|nr:hypothetical protein [Candidatus Sericytochromatia bacterium]
MSNKDLATQSYEKKIVTALREEKYNLPSLKKNNEFLDSLSIIPNSRNNIANKFYKDNITKATNLYIDSFNELILPLVAEKGTAFEVPEEQLNELMNLYDIKVSRIVEKLQLINRVQDEMFYDLPLISATWGLCIDGMENFPLMMALGSNKIIVLDEDFNMDLHFFASLGAMPDIRPTTKAGNIDLPPNSYNIDLQMMVGNDFKKISILLLKHKLEKLDSFFSFMVNIGLIVDTKSSIKEDFSGLKWIKNSLQYSLFKNKSFLNLTKIMKVGGLIIDKSVSPMQVQKIQSMMKSNVNLDIGFEINKLGILQYSVIQKTDNLNLIFDPMEDMVCRMPEVINKSSKFNNY